MTTIELKIPDNLAKRLRPHQNELVQLLELGLEQRLAQEKERVSRQQIMQALRESGLVEMPQPLPVGQVRERHTPMPMNGRPLSEIIVEQRGAL